MIAVILVGGEGTRLRPLTSTTPKQMLPVAGRPMICHVIEHLAAHGVDRAVLSLGYRPDAFVAAFPADRCGGVELAYAVEDAPLDTAGAIAFAAGLAGVDDTFVVVNGDVLTDLDVGELVGFHRRSGAEGTIALTPVDDPSRFGVVPTDGAGRVTAFVEKPPAAEAPTNLVNAGTYVCEPGILARVPPGRRVSIEREVFPAMVAHGSLFAMASVAAWADVGTPAAYLEANLERAAADGPRPGDHPSASVVASVVGTGTVVGAGARVEGSLLLGGVRVEAGALVRSSIVGAGAAIGEGATVEALSVVGDGAVVADGARLVGQRWA